jgi:hypothetical protein
MTQRKIVSVKLNDDNTLDVVYLDHVGEEGQIDKVTKECKAKAHPDLVAEFDNLRIHMGTLCEQGEFTEYEDGAKPLDILRVTKIAFGGEDEHQGITITGMRLLKNAKVLNLNAPFTKLHPDHSDYGYVQSLELSLQNLLSEADQYLNGTKVAPSNQLGLFDQQSETEGEEEQEEEQPKKSRRKKESALKVA